VAVENLTVRNALINGLFWTGVRGYRASYVTAYNNKDHGSTFSLNVRSPAGWHPHASTQASMLRPAGCAAAAYG
jgi:hypothetical protein